MYPRDEKMLTISELEICYSRRLPVKIKEKNRVQQPQGGT